MSATAKEPWLPDWFWEEPEPPVRPSWFQEYLDSSPLSQEDILRLQQKLAPRDKSESFHALYGGGSSPAPSFIDPKWLSLPSTPIPSIPAIIPISNFFKPIVPMGSLNVLSQMDYGALEARILALGGRIDPALLLGIPKPKEQDP